MTWINRFLPLVVIIFCTTSQTVFVMFTTPRKKHVIYLQIILFLLGSFTLLIQNAMATTCHLHENDMEHMSMQMDLSAEPVQLNLVKSDHGKAGSNDKCCENCNCVGQNCTINCSMFHSMAMTMSNVDNMFVHGSKPAVSILLLAGISDYPERRPPRLTVL